MFLRCLLLLAASLPLLAGCSAPNTPVPVKVSTVSMARMSGNSIVVTPDPQPNNSGPHQTNILINTKPRGIIASGITASLSADQKTITITVPVQDPFNVTAP